MTAKETIEALGRDIAALVAERQSLRGTDAGLEELEQNRLEICGLQRRLAAALIACYLPVSAAA